VKLSKKKTNIEQPVADAVPSEQVGGTGGIASGFAVIIFGLLMGAACAAAIVYFQVLAGAQKIQDSRHAENYAGYYSSLLNQSIAQIENQQKQLASDLEIRAAFIAASADEKIRLASSLPEKIPYLVRAQLYAIGEAQVDEHPVASVGHAAVQMIKWAQQKKPTPAEIHQKKGQQLIYTVEPVLGQSGASIGVLLLVFDLAILQQPLSALDGSMGQARIYQQFSGISEKEIFAIGSSSLQAENRVIETRLANVRWKLKFTPSIDLLGEDVFAIEYLLIACAVWLLIGVIAIFISYKLLSAKLTHNAQELFRYVSNLNKKNGREKYQFSLDLFESLSMGMSHLMSGYAKKKPSQKKRSKATQSILKNIEGAVDTAPQVGLSQHEIPSAKAFSGIEDDYAEEMTVPLEIFRAYDIRGVFEQTLTVETTSLIGQAIGSEVIDQGERTVIVASDGRLSSPALKTALIEGLIKAGCDVVDIGSTATPVLYFAVHHLNHSSAVMITGSHNPKDYNGLKIVIDGITLAEERIQSLYHRVLQGDFVSGNGQVENVDIGNQYVNRICNDVALIADPIKVVVDCGNGIAGAVAPFLLKALGTEVIELYCDVDGTFPNHPPDPSKEENLQDLVSRVTKEGADLGLAFDGDGDRLVVVSGSGKIIAPDRLMMLFVQDIVSRNPGADVVYDVKSTKHLAEVISEAGGRPVMWKSGHSLMKAKSGELGALIAGEYSGHLFFRERWYGFDDGIYSAARLLEVLSTEGLTLDELMSEFPWSPSTPELDIEMADEQKFMFIEKFRTQAQFEGGSRTDLDGVRVDFSNGWGLVRASNTMPKLTLRFEADDEAGLAQIQALFKQQLLAQDSQLKIPF